MVADFYQVLGVQREASEAEIRNAYRKKAMNLIPSESVGAESEDNFSLLQAAYDTLSDPSRRIAYDKKNPPRKEKPVIQSAFSPPPPLSSPPVAPASYYLSDGTPYVFETSPSVIRSAISNSDVIQHGNTTGIFIGLAGDNCWWWQKNSASFPSRLCDPSSSMERSKIRVIHRVRQQMDAGKIPEIPLREKLGIGSSNRLKPNPLEDVQKESDEEKAAREELLRKLKEEILESGRHRFRDAVLETFISQEEKIRRVREESFLEDQAVLHSTYHCLHDRILAGRGPSGTEWKDLMRDAQKPLTPFYLKPRKSISVGASTASTSSLSPTYCDKDGGAAKEGIPVEMMEHPCATKKGTEPNLKKKKKKTTGKATVAIDAKEGEEKISEKPRKKKMAQKK